MRNGRGGMCCCCCISTVLCIPVIVVDIPGNGSAVLSFAHRHSVCAYVLYVHVSVVIDIRPRLFLSILYSKMSTFVCHGLRK
jgi:hypothetical protein